MATTYLCSLDGEGGFQKHVVIKLLDPDRVDDPIHIHMFLDEARLWARFNHANIPQLYELGNHAGTPYIVMEYVPGPTLFLLTRRMSVPHNLRELAMIAHIGAEVALALDYAWYGTDQDGAQFRVVHRDVSLSNIVVSTSGVTKLVDFGIALAEGRLQRTESGTLKGRIQYLAPEQLVDRTVDHRTDLFQLGITLYHIITGQPAYPCDDRNTASMWRSRMEGRIAPILKVDPHCPPDLARIVERCLVESPEARYQRGADVAEDLRRFVSATHPIETSDVAAWVAEVFPKKEWASPHPGQLPTSGSSLSIFRSAGPLTEARLARAATEPAGTRTRWIALGALILGGFTLVSATVLAVGSAIVAVEMHRTDSPVPGPTEPPSAASR